MTAPLTLNMVFADETIMPPSSPVVLVGCEEYWPESIDYELDELPKLLKLVRGLAQHPECPECHYKNEPMVYADEYDDNNKQYWFWSCAACGYSQQYNPALAVHYGPGCYVKQCDLTADLECVLDFLPKDKAEQICRECKKVLIEAIQPFDAVCEELGVRRETG